MFKLMHKYFLNFKFLYYFFSYLTKITEPKREAIQDEQFCKRNLKKMFTLNGFGIWVFFYCDTICHILKE